MPGNEQAEYLQVVRELECYVEEVKEFLDAWLQGGLTWEQFTKAFDGCYFGAEEALNLVEVLQEDF